MWVSSLEFEECEKRLEGGTEKMVTAVEKVRPRERRTARGTSLAGSRKEVEEKEKNLVVLQGHGGKGG
jgi:hypothetical protein